ncbi:MAG TPA: hypothetical protein VFP98_01420 [Candidatus Polarisedimenticolia bacterium]|nr:hypothetical protein [Candidatus Polarisedimenticolia bacterium]
MKTGKLLIGLLSATKAAMAATAALTALAAQAQAQQSASFMIKEATLNSGGQPWQGANPASPSYILRPDSLGEGFVSPALTSASFRLSAGHVQAFPTPGEVDNLALLDSATLVWDPEPLAGHYHLYRAGPMGVPTGVGPVADCLQGDLTGTTAGDPVTPPPGQAFFYFVNAVNCIGVQGPDGVIGVPCP